MSQLCRWGDGRPCHHASRRERRYKASVSIMTPLGVQGSGVRESPGCIGAHRGATSGHPDNHCGAEEKSSMAAAQTGKIDSKLFFHGGHASPCPSLMKRLLGGQNLDGVLAVNWGVMNEQEGVKTFQQACQVEVLDCGLSVSKSGILGASPDGFIRSSALLEVKCPYSQRNSTIAEAVKTPSFYLCVEGQGFSLKKTHEYWHQVQGQLHQTDQDLCYFVVWTTKEAAVIPIPKDSAWGQHLLILEDFYRQHILPVLISRED
uniref:YqaJ viral recombinase domain-containing protein n=1 Tax=Myripristis murdjan TaxID=586833 RepID=A0A668AA77_9TELE